MRMCGLPPKSKACDISLSLGSIWALNKNRDENFCDGVESKNNSTRFK